MYKIILNVLELSPVTSQFITTRLDCRLTSAPTARLD